MNATRCVHAPMGHNVAMRVRFCGWVLLLLLLCPLCWPQENPTQVLPQISQEQAVNAQAKPCVEPPPLVRWEDYQGPLQKIVGSFARALERKSVLPPHYKTGTVLCSQELREQISSFRPG